MKTVITYGTFDLLHYGHMNLLKRAKAYGDKLIVGVSSDEFALEKGKKTCYDLNKRMEMLRDLRYVDLVIPEYSMSQKVDDCINIMLIFLFWEVITVRFLPRCQSMKRYVSYVRLFF